MFCNAGERDSQQYRHFTTGHQSEFPLDACPACPLTAGVNPVRAASQNQQLSKPIRETPGLTWSGLAKQINFSPQQNYLLMQTVIYPISSLMSRFLQIILMRYESSGLRPCWIHAMEGSQFHRRPQGHTGKEIYARAESSLTAEVMWWNQPPSRTWQ